MRHNEATVPESAGPMIKLSELPSIESERRHVPGHQIIHRDLASTDEIDALIDAHAPVSCSTSSGKDSVAMALAVDAYLNHRGHKGPRLLIYADLGMVEWEESLQINQELAARLGWELQVVRRAAGGLMERWESRWESSVRRYANLETVTLVLPWSGPALKFCTSELKTKPLTSYLVKRFRGGPIINVTGIRRAESSNRQHATAGGYEPGHSTKQTSMFSWRPIVNWSARDDFQVIEAAGLRPHPGYTEYSMQRLSCRFCVLANLSDLQHSAANPAHADLYRRMVDLEIRSTFGFQGARWLGDVAPSLLTEHQRSALAQAKANAATRKQIEGTIDRSLLYVAGWPTRLPSRQEAELLAGVRKRVAELVGIQARYQDAQSIVERYEELIATREAKALRKSPSRQARQQMLAAA